jgi:hypothetical protein
MQVFFAGKIAGAWSRSSGAFNVVDGAAAAFPPRRKDLRRTEQYLPRL